MAKNNGGGFDLASFFNDQRNKKALLSWDSTLNKTATVSSPNVQTGVQYGALKDRLAALESKTTAVPETGGIFGMSGDTLSGAGSLLQGASGIANSVLAWNAAEDAREDAKFQKQAWMANMEINKAQIEDQLQSRGDNRASLLGGNYDGNADADKFKKRLSNFSFSV